MENTSNEIFDLYHTIGLNDTMSTPIRRDINRGKLNNKLNSTKYEYNSWGSIGNKSVKVALSSMGYYSL